MSSCTPMRVWVYSRGLPFIYLSLLDSTLLRGWSNCGWMPGCTFPRQKGRTNSSLFFPFVYLMALVIINRCGVIRNYSWVYIGRWLHGTLLELNSTLVLLTRKGFVKYFVCWTILLQIRPVFILYLTQHFVCVGKWAIKFRNEFWIWTFFPAPKRVWASPFDCYSHLNPRLIKSFITTSRYY